MKKTIHMKVLILLLYFINSFYLSAQIDPDLVLYLPFNGNANDTSGFLNNGTVYGATLTTGRTGDPNTAYSFNGTSDYIEVINAPSLNPDYITLCAWVNAQDAPSQTPDIIRKSTYADASNEQYLLRLTNSNYPQAGVKVGTNCATYGTNWNFCNSTSTIVPFSTWHFVVSTFDGKVLNVYVDGILVSTSIVAIPGPIMKCGSNLRIGLAWSGYPDYFQGAIDEVRIYKRALTACEVNNLYNDIEPSNSAMVLYLPFNGNAYDSSYYSNDGTLYGPTLTTGVDGTPNSAYSFDGVSDYIEIANDTSLNPDYITLAAWVNAQDAPSHTPDIIRKSTFADASNEQYLLRLTNSNYPQAGIKTGNSCAYEGTNWDFCNSSSSISLSSWHFIVSTFDGTNLRLYIDGVFNNSYSLTTPDVLTKCGSDLRIGLAWSNYPNYYKGIIDEVRIYNRALTSCEISNLFNSQTISNPVTTGTVNGTDNNSFIIFYPNPFSNTFSLMGDINQVSGYDIYSVTGEKVLTGIYNGKIDASILKTGVYIINVYDSQNNIVETKRLMKL